MGRFRVSLSLSIAVFFVGFLLLIWFLLSTIVFRTTENSLVAHRGDEARLVLGSFLRLLPAGQATAPLPHAAEAFLASLSEDRDFRGLLLVAADGSILHGAAGNPTSDEILDRLLREGGSATQIIEGGEVLNRYEARVVEGRPVLAARLSLSLREERLTLARTRQMFLAYFLLDSLLLICVGFYCSHRFIVRPIQRLLHATQRVTSGQFDHRVDVAGSTELASLADSFNRMQGALKAKEEELASNFRTLAQAHEELKTAREETMRSEKMASVGLLAAGMGHEIGTPLASIMGYGTMLRDELAPDPARADFAARIVEEAERIDRIVRGLLAFARPEPGERELLQLPELVASLRELLETQGFFRTIALTLQQDRPLPLVVADRSMLQQVLLNLCLNARDAMPSGGELVIRLLRVKDEAGAAAVRIEVEDTGTGIEAEHLSRIFDPFFTTKEPGKGTGLGLAIAARIIESFGGTITAASRPGAGTLFSICMPAVFDGEASHAD
jgi:hypothetical protein